VAGELGLTLSGVALTDKSCDAIFGVGKGENDG
jgi:hypothetical protein